MYGIDVSHYQSPESTPYAQCDFVIVKASEGGTIDSSAYKHVENVRKHSKILGLYHFYRRDQDFAAQARTFLNAAEALRLGPGDLFPCLDLEQHKGLLPNNGWNHPAEAIAQVFEERFGGCIVYCNMRDFHLLGSPKWILDRPLWHAQWPLHQDDFSAPKDPVLWQHRVGPFEYEGSCGRFKPESFDQSHMLLEDPTEITIQGEDEEPEKVKNLVAATEAQEIREKLEDKKA
jgi:GH25 family lysozyme M1 (1,4-beta-N-acetylmuramidase)